jgi:nitrate reductase cytochrome c-type subunit
LVGLAVDGRNLPLRKCIVERVVDRLQADAEARSPPSCASDETSRNSGSRRISVTSFCDHFVTSAASVPVSVYWYCERLDWVDICTSCTGWK